MTKKELSQYYWLKKEIERDVEKLRELESRAYYPGSMKLTGMPGGGGVGQPTEKSALMLVELREKIRSNIAKHEKIVKSVDEFIEDIDDSLTRQIFKMRFTEGESWEKIALKLGGGNTQEGVRKRVYRYLETRN